MNYTNSADMRLAAAKQAVQIPSEEENGKPTHDKDFEAGFTAGKAAYAKNDKVSKTDADKAYKAVSKKYGTWWTEGYVAAIDIERGATSTKPAQIAKKMKLAAGRRPDPANMKPEAATDMADDIREEVRRRAGEAVDFTEAEIQDQQRMLRDIKHAWGKWDWEELHRLNLISKDDKDFVREVLAMYSW